MYSGVEIARFAGRAWQASRRSARGVGTGSGTAPGEQIDSPRFGSRCGRTGKQRKAAKDNAEQLETV